MLARMICLVIGYALGQILTADLVSRRVAGKPAFEQGVGNPGMANVGHELGTKWALAVLAGDLGKVILAAAACRLLFPGLGWTVSTAWAGFGATLGHNFPLWHRFRGGKGVSATCAAIILASPLMGIPAALLGAVGIIVCGYLCVGAIIITVAWLLFCLIAANGDLILTGIGLLVLMVLAHGSAVSGIRTGDTPVASLSNKLLRKAPALRGPCLAVRKLFGGPAQNQDINAKSVRSSSSARGAGHAGR